MAYLEGAHLMAAGKAKRKIGMRASVPAPLRIGDGLVTYRPAGNGAGLQYVPESARPAQSLLATSRIQGGVVSKVGPPLTGVKKKRPVSLGRKNPAKKARKCSHRPGADPDREPCGTCSELDHGIVSVATAKAGEGRRAVEAAAHRLPSLVGYFVLEAQSAPLEDFADTTRLRTAAILVEDAAALALELKGNPVMREAIAAATQGVHNLPRFRTFAQAIYALQCLLPEQFAELLSDGVAAILYKNVLAFPKGAEVAREGEANRLALTMAPLKGTATNPQDPIVLAMPAMLEVLQKLKDPRVQRRLFISFVHNGTGTPGVVSELDRFAPGSGTVPPRATIRVGRGPITWGHLSVLIDTFDTLIIEGSYFNPAEVALFVVAGIMLNLRPENVCTQGMAIMHDALRGMPREPYALERFALAQKHDQFAQVREGLKMPEIVVNDAGTTNLARAKRVHPLIQTIVAALDPEVRQGPSHPLATEESAHTTE